MIFTKENIVLVILITLCIVLVSLLRFLLKQKNKKQLHRTFIIIFELMLLWLGCMILQILFMDNLHIDIKYFFYVYYVSLSFLPVAFLFMALSFSRGNVEIKRYHLLLFVIPILSVLLMWTNDLHHLFYQTYSIDVSTEYGWYFYVHTIYTYLLFAISIFILSKYSIKNSGFFSKQAMLIFIGASVPLVVNSLGAFQIIQISIYTTPITFAVTLICFSFGILKFNLFTVTPIALQRIVDRISDSYLVLNDNYVITDFNKTLLTTFELKDTNIRNVNIFNFISSNKKLSVNKKILKKALIDVKDSTKTVTFEKTFSSINKHFHIEINTITSNNKFLGTLILFKDTTQHIKDMQTIKDSQTMLMEQERLATLGQMVGGIAHNLKTPIMSIAGAMEGLQDLVQEYEQSIGDPDVTIEDHLSIAKDMHSWIEKVNSYDAYMSDIITTVKGQAVNFNDVTADDFTVDELIKRINILMKHELKNALVVLNVNCAVPETTIIHGNINSLVQIVNNLISNSIQAYNSANKDNRIIDLNITSDKNNTIITVEDYACGIPKEVQEKLFKSMVTTKGHKGTGLGLFMSYSTIKGHFNGDLNFTSEVGKGTKFNIVLPG